ncbi:MAG: hypothetical protein KC466_19455, partial [Myxococcales bacterium]|nr:hypothetical protein [Myxococcales bacterium]
MPFVASTARAEPPFAISPGPVETAAQTAFRTLSVEFGLEGETLYRRDIERVRGRHLRTVESEQDFTMSLAGELGPRVDFNFEIQGAWALNATNEIPGYASFGFVKRGETWIRARDLLGEDLALKVGRFEFRDLRGWWWDEDLDAVEIRWRRGPLALSVAGGTEVASDGTDERVLAADRRGVWRVFGHAVWRAGPAARLEAFFLHAFDRSPTEHLGETTRARDVDPVDADLYWVGLRSTG